MAHRRVALAAQVFLWLAGRRRRYRVTGNSMCPTLRPGEAVFVDPRAYRGGAPRPGDVIVARHPFQRDVCLVKRVDTTLPDGNVVLAGDNANRSTDSRVFGAVPRLHVVGRVVFPPCESTPALSLARTRHGAAGTA